MMVNDGQRMPLLHTLEDGSPLSLSGGATASKTQHVPQNPEELRQAAKQYEAFFISYLMKVMRETVHETGTAGKGAEYFYSFYDQEVGNRAAEVGGIGITRMVEAYIEKNFSPAPQVQRQEFR